MSAESRSSAGWVRFHSMASSTCSMMWSDASRISSWCCSASNGSRLERERVRPVPQLRLLRDRHAEHVRDHPERQREREVGDHVHAVAARDDRVERVVDHHLHPGRQLLDHPGCEHLLHQLPQTGVVGRVEVQDLVGAPLRAVAEDLLADLGPRVAADDAAVLHAEARVAQQPDGVVVAEQRPQAERRLLHRIARRELGELRVRVLGEARFERVERFRLTGHISHSGHQGCGGA